MSSRDPHPVPNSTFVATTLRRDANFTGSINSSQSTLHREPAAPQHRCQRCVPCCFDPVPWRSSCWDCLSHRFVKSMNLFEDLTVEALYLRHAKTSRRAKIVPPVITALAVVASLVSYVLEVHFSIYLLLCLPAVLFAVAGFAASGAQTCQSRIQYQLRASTLALAVATATAAFLSILVLDIDLNGTASAAGLLWVCQKALVISDVVAARVLVVIVPFNTLVLLVGIVFLVLVLLSTPAPLLIRAALELGTSVLAASGVLLWLALRNESTSRTVFYWSHITKENVETLDAEANPFHQHRLQAWLSECKMAQQKPSLTSEREPSAQQFWELNGAFLRLDSKIAAGGGGIVWKATYKTKVVAAKQLYGGATADSSQLEELAAEVGVLAQLSHCNIVRFLGLCRHHDESEASSSAYLPLFIVQEYCPTNLRAAFSDIFPAMPRDKWPLEVRRVSLEIARAVTYLHSRKVTHRDLKPENILLTSRHSVRVADFGVSVQFLHGLSTSESIGGTPAYMSPEAMCASFGDRHTRSDQLVNEAAGDVYAFGVVLCELLLSDSGAGIACELADNAANNRKLSSMPQFAARCGDFECEWAYPPFHDVAGQTLLSLSKLGRRCCSFDVSDRPSFTHLCHKLGKPGAQFVDSSGRSRSDTELGRTTWINASRSWDKKSINSAQRTTTPLLSAEAPMSVDDAEEVHNQAAVSKCACSCWTRGRLRFADDKMEDRFVAFLHSHAFFRYLRWPYVVLTTLEVVFGVTMLAIGQVPYALYPLIRTLMFGAAALFSWFSGLRRFSMVTLSALALAGGGVRCAIVWAPLFDSMTIVPGNATPAYCVCSVALNESCPASCLTTSSVFLFSSILLPLVQDLTIPVTLLVLGLPLYLYAWLLGMSIVSWMGTIIGGILLLHSPAYSVHFLSSILHFTLLSFAGLALFPICTITAISGERARRQMFLKLCSLRTQESTLREDATFRGYRQALLANWRYLAAAPGDSTHSPASHVVTAATI